MKRKFLALCLAVLLLMGTMSGVRASGSLFFVAVNDDIPLLLPGDTAAYYANGMLYAPYTVFNAAPGNISVSVTEEGLLSLFTLGQTLVFDPNAGTMTEKNGLVSEVDVVYRGGILYIPVLQAAKCFGLSVSILTSRTGCSILRFTNGSEKYDNEKFLDRSELFVQHMMDQYGGLSSGEISETPEDDPPVEEEPVYDGELALYLAFAGEAVNEETLKHLDAYADVHALDTEVTFFLTERQFLENKNLVRQIYGSGHTIGLTVDEMQTDISEALFAANDAMDQVLYLKSLMVLLPEGMTPAESWCVFEEPQIALTMEGILAQPETVQMMVCRTDAADLLKELLDRNVSLLPLLETTQLAAQTAAEETNMEP